MSLARPPHEGEHSSSPPERGESQLCHVRRLGLLEYEDATQAQSLLARARKEELIPDQLLLLEHPHVVTIGRRTRHLSSTLSDHLRVSPEQLVHQGVELHETDRGGAVTYHGPGQLVAYPIVKLTGRRRDVHRYLRDLEEVLIRTLRDFGIPAGRASAQTGVWVGQEKIASIGVHLSHWVTTHGLALNVNTDLRFFDLIVPCGLKNARMTSMEKLLGSPIPMNLVQERFLVHFQDVFERQLVERPIEAESVQVLLRTPHGMYLLLKRTREEGGFWQPVTGFVEPGESPSQTALREVREETGVDLRREGAGDLSPLVPLPYVHTFALSLAESSTPLFVREYSFVALLRTIPPIRLNPTEHEAFQFVDITRALSLVPWKGNRRALMLSEQMCRRAEGSPDVCRAPVLRSPSV